MRTEQRGLIPVYPRDPETREVIEGSKPINFPVGEDLVHALRERYDFNQTHESNAIKRYATSAKIDWRDVLDAYLEEEELGRMKVERFLTNSGLRPLFSPIVEDGLRIGLNRVAPNWQGLIARNIPVPGMAYEYYEFDNGSIEDGVPTGLNEFTLRRVGQGAPIPVARVTVSGKSYSLYKQGRGIEWTDEAKVAPIDLAALWFQQVGLQLGWDYYDTIVDALLNGHFDDGTDAPPVLAVDDGNDPGEITFADLLMAIGTMQTVYGYTPSVMVMSLARAVAVQVMENGAGYPQFPNGVTAAGLPPIQISSKVPDDKIIFVDTGFAMMRLVQKEFGTEFDRDVRSQVEGSYGTSVELTVPLFPQARIVLDS